MEFVFDLDTLTNNTSQLQLIWQGSFRSWTSPTTQLGVSSTPLAVYYNNNTSYPSFTVSASATQVSTSSASPRLYRPR